MKQRIFVGSSSEGLEKAHRISELLVSLGEIEPLLWTSVFEPGLLTFEALENMLQQCCGAVFIASPDDESVVRGASIKTPNSNILLEFGLVAGRVGRHNIALCVFGSVTLPSDLKGLTVIEMDSSQPQVEGRENFEQPKDKLRSWTSTLLMTAGMIPRTDVVHGYSGRWAFELQLDHWRSIPITAPHYVYVKGTFVLVVPANGQAGIGLAQGRMYFSLDGDRDVNPGLYQGEFHTSHEIATAACERDGALCFTSQAFAVEKINASGAPPAILAGLDAAEPWSAQWRLTPSAGPRNLEGIVSTDSSIGTHGKAKAVRI
jgi:hypothetical protein